VGLVYDPRGLPGVTTVRPKVTGCFNILRVITSDNHVISVKKKKSPTTRRHVNAEGRIMSASGKTSCCDHRGKTLKSNPRSLLKTIDGAIKVTNHALGDRIPRWWMHVNIFT
jgi:hypothetical protein